MFGQQANFEICCVIVYHHITNLMSCCPYPPQVVCDALDQMPEIQQVLDVSELRFFSHHLSDFGVVVRAKRANLPTSAIIASHVTQSIFLLCFLYIYISRATPSHLHLQCLYTP